ncbi:unnamed protein product [Brassica oleracea var. botrytis]
MTTVLILTAPCTTYCFKALRSSSPLVMTPHQSQRFSSTTTSKLNLAPNMEEQEAESGFVELSDYSSAEDTPMYRPSDEETHLASELFCCHDIPSLHSSLPFPSPSGTFSLLLCQHTSKYLHPHSKPADNKHIQKLNYEHPHPHF